MVACIDPQCGKPIGKKVSVLFDHGLRVNSAWVGLLCVLKLCCQYRHAGSQATVPQHDRKREWEKNSVTKGGSFVFPCDWWKIDNSYTAHEWSCTAIVRVQLSGSGIMLKTVAEGKKLVSYTAMRALEGEDGVVETERNAVKATVNGKEVALFYWKEQLFCVDAQCPHMGKKGVGWVSCISLLNSFCIILTTSLWVLPYRWPPSSWWHRGATNWTVYCLSLAQVLFQPVWWTQYQTWGSEWDAGCAPCQNWQRSAGVCRVFSIWFVMFHS